MSAPLPIERLKRLAVGDPEPGDTAWFAEQFEDYEKRAPHGARLDELLGLVPGLVKHRGGRVAASHSATTGCEMRRGICRGSRVVRSR